MYEGSFIEKINGTMVPYEHAFIVASKDKRHLVIDLSRTSKRLLFQETNDSMMYPEIEDYEEVCKISQERLNLDDLLTTDIPEYFTGWKPEKFMEIINVMIEVLKSKPLEDRLKFCDNIYSKTTMLRR